VRIFQPPTEGRIIHGYEGLEVGDRVMVRLENINVPKAYIDFSAIR
jgi:RNase II-type exonuclease